MFLTNPIRKGFCVDARSLLNCAHSEAEVAPTGRETGGDVVERDFSGRPNLPERNRGRRSRFFVAKPSRFAGSPGRLAGRDQNGDAMQQDQILTRLGAALVEGSLTDEALLVQTEAQPVLPILPDANVVKVGGQSLIDRGGAAVLPLIDEIVANLRSPQDDHCHRRRNSRPACLQRRSRSRNADRGAQHPRHLRQHAERPHAALSAGQAWHPLHRARAVPAASALSRGAPGGGLLRHAALSYWQPNPAVGRIPPHRTDTGAYLVSEVFGARQ